MHSRVSAPSAARTMEMMKSTGVVLPEEMLLLSFGSDGRTTTVIRSIREMLFVRKLAYGDILLGTWIC